MGKLADEVMKEVREARKAFDKRVERNVAKAIRKLERQEKKRKR